MTPKSARAAPGCTRRCPTLSGNSTGRCKCVRACVRVCVCMCVCFKLGLKGKVDKLVTKKKSISSKTYKTGLPSTLLFHIFRTGKLLPVLFIWHLPLYTIQECCNVISTLNT